MDLETWLDLGDDDGFGVHNLPYGVFSRVPNGPRRIGVAIGDRVLDVAAVADRLEEDFATLLHAQVLNPLLEAGKPTWRAVRKRIRDWLTDRSYQAVVLANLFSRSGVTLHLPFEVGDYVDFFASEYHARNVGRIVRSGTDSLPPSWKHQPLGYHGRSGTVVVSGTAIVRPRGQRRASGDPGPTFGPSRKLDFEAEIGFVVGAGTTHGEVVAVDAFADHVFGVCLLNDWSARDLQAWESVPLGPFLGKSFATSVSAWVVPWDALREAAIPASTQDPEPLPYLRSAGDRGLDIRLEVRLNGSVVARPPFSALYWTPAQQLAHMTANGASLRAGDLFASGTVSGPESDERGCLLELTWDGLEPLILRDGTHRSYLNDGDEVRISAFAPGPGGSRIGFGEVTGRVLPTIGGGKPLSDGA